MANVMAEIMEATWRWYGPDDPVSLAYAKQAGATGIVTALHDVPTGDVWDVEAIRARQRVIAASGLVWSVVESVPVHESIKRGASDCDNFIANYQQTLRNLGQCGLAIICYNFMPVLDWTRTELDRRYSDESEALVFDLNDFAAFELCILRRPGAEAEYDPASHARALRHFDRMSPSRREAVSRAVLAGLPGGTTGAYTAEQLQAALDSYRDIDAPALRSNLVYFLQRVIPTAEQAGVYLAIHPDDPPFPLLGLPRVVSCDDDIQALLAAVPSKHNGLTFCVGSYASSPANKARAQNSEGLE
jgi:mannonate dehydratase